MLNMCVLYTHREDGLRFNKNHNLVTFVGGFKC
jgi:hypothetical protein